MKAPSMLPRLNVGTALDDGWRAFRRAPWLFVGFALLLAVLQFALQAFQPSLSVDKLPSLTPELLLNDWEAQLPRLTYGAITLGLLVLTSVVGVVVNLWGTSGMVRAAWVALGGGTPSVGTFLRWDPRALLRLYLPGFLLGCGVAVAVVVLVLLAVVLGQVSPLLVVPPALLLLAAALYLSLSQSFLPQVALIHDDHPFDALARGRQMVDPVWPQVLLLALLNGGLVLAGALACGVGLFVAIPLVACVATAAYRQLFGPVDHTGFTRRELAARR
ncbi:MAG: hypothetical protein VKP70_09735 [Cyanobacteriota bacterium]|nr:hypothetical protein [Cyanobacteriota bacterium]